MMRSVTWLRTRALDRAIVMVVVPMNGIAAAQDVGGIEISRIDLDAFPEVGFDVAVRRTSPMEVSMRRT